MSKEEFEKFKAMFNSENEDDKFLAWEVLNNRDDVSDIMFCYLSNTGPFGIKRDYNNYWMDRFNNTGLDLYDWNSNGFNFDDEDFETVLTLELIIDYDQGRI